MINKIIDGISNAIFEKFREGYEIYSEHMPQGFKEPCFFILCLNPSENQVLGMRYHRTYLFNIQYFPKSKKEFYKEIYDVQSKLTDCLEFINVENGVIQGTKRRDEIHDKILNFFVNYNVHVLKKEEYDLMGELALKQKVGGVENE